MRICLVYDCLFPYTVGGAERWYRNLAQRLAADGHEVTYLTLRQWERGEQGDVPGVRVRAVGPRMALYRGRGERRIVPPLVFGAGVLWHLLRHGGGYDVIHTASFPYFSVLAAGAARRVHGFRLVVDWHELWSRGYWRLYLGAAGGRVGWAVQALCLHIPQRAFCFAQLTAERLRAEGVRGDVTVLEGEYAGPLTPPAPAPAEPVAVFAGRHIPEKRAPALVPAVGLARARVPGLRGRVLGDGPERGAVLAAIERHGLAGVVDAPGFVPTEQVAARPGAGALHGAAVRARGLRARRRRGVRGRHAEHRRARRGQRRHRAGRARRQRLRRRQRLARGPRRRDRARARRGRAAARVDGGLVRAQRAPPLDRHLARRGGRQLRRRDAVTPRVSVLIGAYDSAATLQQAIGAVLGQTVRELELIVIDDGSADDSAAIAEAAAARDPRARLLRMPANVGISRSLNAGIEAAAAPVVAVQDADDVSAPQRLERQLELLDARPDVAVVGSRMREVDEHGAELRARTAFAAGDVRGVLLRFNPIPNTSAAFRRDLVLAAGGYDPRYRYAMEYDLWLRLAERHAIVALDEVLATRRMSRTNVAARRERQQIAEALAIRWRALRRRRTLRGASGLVLPAVSYVTPLPAKRALRRRLGQAP